MVNFDLRIKYGNAITFSSNPLNNVPDIRTSHPNDEYVVITKDTDISAKQAGNTTAVANINIGGNKAINAIAHVYVQLPKKGLKSSKTLGSLLRLRSIIKDETTNDNTNNRAVIFNVDEADCSIHDGDARLVIKKFGNFGISSYVNDNAKKFEVDSTVPKDNLEAWETALGELVEVLNKGYNDYKDLSKIESAEINYLKAFQDNPVAHLNDKGNDPDINKKIKQTLYRLSTDGANEDYKVEIDNRIRELEELVFWRDELGFTSLDDVLRANANGFTIFNRYVGTNRSNILTIGARTAAANWDNDFVGGLDNANTKAGNLSDNDNKAAIKKVLSSKKYRGFDIIDSSQKVKTNAERGNVIYNRNTTLNTETNVNESLFGEAFSSSANHTKANIDAFRTIFHDTTKNNKEDFRGFSVEDAPHFANVAAATADKDATRAEYAGVDIMDKNPEIKGRLDGKKLDPANTTGEKTYKNDDLKFTKVIYRATAIANKTAAVNLFYGTDFDTAIGTKKEVLDMLFIAIQDHANWVGNFNYQNASDAEKKEITDTYKKFKSFLNYYDVDYTTWDDSKKTELQKVNEELVKYQNETSTSSDYYINASGRFWAKLIGEQLSEISRAQNRNKKKKDGDKWQDQLKNLQKGKKPTENVDLEENSEYLKEFWKWDQITESAIGTKEKFDELVSLATLVDNVWKKSGPTTKNQLTDYETAATSDPKKFALDLLKKFEKDNKKWWDEAKTKAKDSKDDDAKLATARTNAKAAMKEKMATGGDDAYTKIIEENKTTLNSVELIDDAVEIFKKCYDAWGKSADDKELREKLADYSSAADGDNKKKVWNAINNFKKNDKNADYTEGFANGALKHLREFIKGRQKEVDESGATTANDATSTRTAIEKLEKSKNDEVINIIIPRLKLMEALFKKGGKYSELAKKIRDNFVKEVETDFEDSTYATNLTKLKNAFDELKKYYKDGSEKGVYDGIGTEEKKLFDDLMSKVEAKVKSMESKKKQDEKNKEETPTPTPFYKTPMGIFLIIVGILAVVGAIAYFIKTSSSEEGEGE